MNNDTIRVGIVGAGKNTTSKHIPGLQTLAGVEVVSLCNRSRASSERVAQQFNIPRVYDTWWELINADDSDAIVIGTWPYMHHQLTLAALAADKHVMCEARMACNAAEAQDMLLASQTKPYLITQIVPSPYSLGVDKTVKRLIAEDYLGDILTIEARQYGDFIDYKAPLHWRHSYDLSGMNIMSLGIWYELLLRWVGEATKVMAMGKTFVRQRLNEETGLKEAVRVPEHLDVIADMACGAQAHLRFSSIAGLGPENEIYLFGSQGTLRFAGGKLYGAQKGAKALQEINIPSEEAGGWRVEEEFIKAIRGEEEITHTNFKDGLKYMEFTEAVNRSLMEDRAIALPL